MTTLTTTAYSDTLAAQAEWLGSKVSKCLALYCIHQIYRMNSCDGSAMMTAPCHVYYLLLLLLLLKQNIQLTLSIHECVAWWFSSKGIRLAINRLWVQNMAMLLPGNDAGQDVHLHVHLLPDEHHIRRATRRWRWLGFYFIVHTDRRYKRQ